MKGATDKLHRRRLPCWHFNPRAREGRDLEGGDVRLNLETDFNPRAREGRDLLR